jgi:hypothetical protein
MALTISIQLSIEKQDLFFRFIAYKKKFKELKKKPCGRIM